jgi:hypothetical protein
LKEGAKPIGSGKTEAGEAYGIPVHVREAQGIARPELDLSHDSHNLDIVVAVAEEVFRLAGKGLKGEGKPFSARLELDLGAREHASESSVVIRVDHFPSGCLL